MLSLERFRLILLLSFHSAAALIFSIPLLGAEAPAPEKWKHDIKAFETLDRLYPPPKDPILFVGSSSIRLWDLERYFPVHTVINRGFGGSQIADSVYYADRIILPYRPRTIVFYAGENDIAAGKTPEQAFQDFKSFAEKVRSSLPLTPILYIGMKPSPLRWELYPQMQEANRLIQKYTSQKRAMKFIDMSPHMLGQDGQPRIELFRKDNLHLNDQGYEIWTQVIKAHLN